MANCISCGSYIEDGGTCSMCFGDVDHGRDNLYRDFLEKQRRDKENSPENQEDWPDDDR